jgi:hypothetical protein
MIDPFIVCMVAQYIATALWSSIDEQPDGNGGPPLDENYGPDDVAPRTRTQCFTDCELFLVFMRGEDLDPSTFDASDLGHDLWLTRNGHGAGFWDGDYGEDVGEKLSNIAHDMGEVNWYAGDDGMIYQMGAEGA